MVAVHQPKLYADPIHVFLFGKEAKHPVHSRICRQDARQMQRLERLLEPRTHGRSKVGKRRADAERIKEKAGT